MSAAVAAFEEAVAQLASGEPSAGTTVQQASEQLLKLMLRGATACASFLRCVCVCVCARQPPPPLHLPPSCRGPLTRQPHCLAPRRAAAAALERLSQLDLCWRGEEELGMGPVPAGAKRIYWAGSLASNALACFRIEGAIEQLSASSAYRIVASCSAAAGPVPDCVVAVQQLAQRRAAAQPAERREAAKFVFHFALSHLSGLQELMLLAAVQRSPQLASAVRSTLCRPERVRRLPAPPPLLPPARLCMAHEGRSLACLLRQGPDPRPWSSPLCACRSTPAWIRSCPRC